MRLAWRFTSIPLTALALLAGCSSDEGTALYAPCNSADECDVEAPGDGVICAAGPTSTQKVCTTKCSQDVDEAKGYAAAAVGDCIRDIYKSGGTVCGTGCCYIETSTQQDPTDQRYAVTGTCVPKAP